MATSPSKTAAPAAAKSSGFQYGPLLAGWLIPGAGHFLQRKWIRGSLLFLSIGGMFSLGLAMQGKLYTSAHEILDMLSFAGDLGSGLFYLVGRQLGLGSDPVQLTTADYGSRFIVIAGLLNVMAAVDAHNLFHRPEEMTFSPSHFTSVLLFALFVSVVFGITMRETPRRMFICGAQWFGGFTGAAIVVSWLMFFLAK